MRIKNDSPLPTLLAKHQSEHQRGESRAFDEIRKRYLARVLAFARRLTGSVEEAEDLTQETFLLAARKSQQFHGQSAFLTWLLTIARNRHIDQVRRTHPTEPLDTLLDNRTFATPSLEEAITQKIIVQNALATLPKAHREAFECVVLQGMTSAETARLLQMPPGTVRWRVAEATKQLRVLLESERE